MHPNPCTIVVALSCFKCTRTPSPRAPSIHYLRTMTKWTDGLTRVANQTMRHMSSTDMSAVNGASNYSSKASTRDWRCFLGMRSRTVAPRWSCFASLAPSSDAVESDDDDDDDSAGCCGGSAICGIIMNMGCCCGGCCCVFVFLSFLFLCFLSFLSFAMTTVLAQVATTYQTNCKSCTARTEATQLADKWQIIPNLFEHIEMEITNHLAKKQIT